MTNAIEVRLAPLSDAELPACRLSGSIPIVSWPGEGYHARIELQLGNHPDPAAYLGGLAHMLSAFAAEVDAARDTRAPRGYSAPVAHVPVEGAFDERRAGEMTQ